MIVAVDEINNFIARANGVARQLTHERGALHRDRRNNPGDERDDRQTGDGEEKQDRLRARHPPFAQMRDHRIEQVGENDRDRDRDEDRLQEAEQPPGDPDAASDDADEQDKEDGAERRPHYLPLPRCRVSSIRVAHSLG